MSKTTKFKIECKLSAVVGHFYIEIPLKETQCCKPLIFQTINSVRSNNLSLKY